MQVYGYRRLLNIKLCPESTFPRIDNFLLFEDNSMKTDAFSVNLLLHDFLLHNQMRLTLDMRPIMLDQLRFWR